MMHPPLPLFPTVLSRRLCLGGLLLWISGCSLAPDYQPPALPVADEYPQEQALSPVTGSLRDWHEYFRDPGLLQVIDLAIDNNRDLRLAALKVAEAQAVYGVQRADRFPTIGLAAEGNRSRVPADLNLTGRTQVAGQYQVGFGLSSWELDFWGRVRSLEQVALERFLASEAAQQATRVSLVAQVANAYLGLQAFDIRLELAAQTAASREESLRIFTRREQLGATSRLDLIQVETLWQQARTLQAQLQQARAAQYNLLTLLVGAPLPELANDPAWDELELSRGLQPGLPSQLLQRRPDILAAEHQLRAANANIGAARAAFFPRITLTGSAGTASAELNGLFDAGSEAWSFVPSLSLPLFDGARNRRNLDLAQARTQQAVVEYEKTIQQAFREVADALAARQWLVGQVDSLEQTRRVQAERARLAKLRYDNGAAAFLEVLDAQRDLLSVEQQLIQVRRELLSSHVNLYAALGGGQANTAQATHE